MSDEGEDRTLKRLREKLIGNPVFPLLFIQKVPEKFVDAGFVVTDSVVHFAIMAVVASLLWAASDTVDIQSPIRIRDGNGFFK